MKMIWQLFIKYKFIILAILISLLSVLDLANYGIPPTHDAEYHVLRFQQFYKVLSAGNLYPRWAPDFNNGFGIPLFDYVYPLPNYVASFFHFLGFGFIDSFKLNMVFASVVGSVFMFLWSKKYWGDWGGLVSSVFYTFSPYHLLDIYVRGSVGEVWSLAIFPGLLWSYLNFQESKEYKYIVVSSILLGLLVYAHNILAAVFFGFFLAYAAFLMVRGGRRVREVGWVAAIIFCGLGLAAPFWIPALLEQKFVQGLQIFNPWEQFPKLYQLIYSSWGYGFSGSGAGEMSLQIGLANLLAIGLALLIYIKRKKKDKSIVFFMVGVFAFTVFLVTPFSIFFWKNIPFVSFIQFPWRLLSVLILIASFLAGSIVQGGIFKNKRTQIIVSVLLIILSIGLSIRYAKAPFYHKRADSHYLTRSNFTDGTNSPGDSFNTIWLKSVPPKAKNRIEVLDGSANLKINELRSTSYIFESISNKSSEVLINTTYFPGWNAEINGVRTNIENYRGKMILKLAPGENKVRIQLKNTPIQTLSYIYFLTSILVLIMFRVVKLRT